MMYYDDRGISQEREYLKVVTPVLLIILSQEFDEKYPGYKLQENVSNPDGNASTNINNYLQYNQNYK